VNTIKTPVRDENGEVTGLLGIFWDITEKKKAEIELKKHRDNLKALVNEQTSELNRKNAVLEAINTVFRESLQCETDEEVAWKCLAVAEGLTGSKFGFVGELNAVGRYDTIAISNPGWNECKLPESEATRLITNMEVRGLWGQIIKEGKSKIINKPEGYPDSVGLPEGHPPLNSFLGVPLRHGNEVTGMIALANKETRVFNSPEHISFVVRRGILGVKAPNPIIAEYTWHPSALLIMHSDGISTHWKNEEFLKMLDKPAQTIAWDMIKRQAKDNDDATIVVVKEKKE